jgi:hypothetical protein
VPTHALDLDPIEDDITTVWDDRPPGGLRKEEGLGWTLHSISHPSKSLHPPNRSTTINVVHMYGLTRKLFQWLLDTV